MGDAEQIFEALHRATVYDEKGDERAFVEKVAARFNWPLDEAYAKTAEFRRQRPGAGVK